MPTDTKTSLSFSSTRRWIIGLNVLLSTVAIVALTLMVNYLAARHFTRLQWTSENPNQLSSLTLDFLQSLTNQVRIVVFFDKQDALGSYSAVSALLNEYLLACPKLHVEYVDYVRNPSAALLIRERYKQAFPGDDFFKNMVLFECNSHIKAVYEKDLYNLDFSDALAGKSKEVKRSQFKGEYCFTSALLNVTETRQKKICFLQGHREHPLQDDGEFGFSNFNALLQQQNLEVESIILTANDIPDDCQLLIIAGPTQPFQPAELEKIDKYLNRGGRLLLLFNYEATLVSTGLEEILDAWGIIVGRNLVIDNQSASKTSRILSSSGILTTNYPGSGHPIMKPLLRSQLQLVLPRSIDKKNLGRQDADMAKVDILVATGSDCQAVTTFIDRTPVPNAFRDRHGPIPVIAAVEKGSIQGISLERGATRMVISGDSVFLANAYLDQVSNRDFASQAINWLLERPKLMGGIGPREVKEFYILMTPSQLFAVRWLLMAILPGVVLLLGFLVWFRRRA